MPTAWGSDVVNGQLVPRAPSSAFFPAVFSAQFTGPGIWPKQGTFQVPPVIPNATQYQAAGPFGNATPGAGFQGYAGGATGTGTAPTNASETGNPFHPTKSPVLFGFLFVAVALFALHYIHW